VLRVSSVDPIKQVAKLGRRNRDDAIGGRWPDKPAPLEPLGIERQTLNATVAERGSVPRSAVMPQDLDEIAKPTIIPHTLCDPSGSNMPGTRSMDGGLLLTAAPLGTASTS
jgi:hypothetical protein